MEYEEFGRKVKQAFEDSKRRYGAVKLCRVLNDTGTPCSIKRVQRHMAEQGLRSVVVKKYSHHANHGSIPDDKVNILKRDFGTETINQKWCTDINPEECEIVAENQDGSLCVYIPVAWIKIKSFRMAAGLISPNELGAGRGSPSRRAVNRCRPQAS